MLPTEMLPTDKTKILIVSTHNDQEWVSKLAYDSLKAEYNHLLKQNQEMSKNGAVVDGAADDMRRITREHTELNGSMNELAMYVRENFQREISMGLHKNMNTAADVAIYYMGKYLVLRDELEVMKKAKAGE